MKLPQVFAWQRRLPIRSKLTIAMVLPMAVAVLVCSILGFYVLVERIGSQAQDKVRSDLNAGLEIFENEIGHIRNVVRFAAGAPYVADALAKGRRDELVAALAPLMESENLLILTAVDSRGQVLARANNPQSYGDDLSLDIYVRQALSNNQLSGAAVLSPARLALEGEALVRQAKVQVIPTPRARPGGEEVVEAGLCLVTAAPVRGADGAVIGALYGAILLNNNHFLVDRIRRVVFKGEENAGKVRGGATIFLDDLRISTNIMTGENQRAVGTRLSEEVYNRVVLENEPWVDRAFVVNDWYFSAYEPIVSVEGKPIGALYVGTLERPFTQLKMNLGLVMVGILLAGVFFGTLVARTASARLTGPIKELQSLAARVAAGERGIVLPRQIDDDEIGDLAREFNRMSESLAGQEDEIRQLNRSLEEKVRLRTAELEQKHELLLKTQQELVRVEKLAAMGELAAGVAHEINNPLAIIRGNCELLQMELPPESSCQEELEIMSRTVGRVERIVANLLEFARREMSRVNRVAVAPMLDEILSQVGHQVELKGISLETDMDRAVEVGGDGDRLHQVFTNLVLNGIQAMPDGGVLAVAVRSDAEAGICTVKISDSGSGIAAEHLEKIFDPFFTTRSNGTGLGLSVSYGIIRDHGGTITVESRPGHGACFTVSLPLSPPV